MNFWLMKSEPDDFGIDHLKARPKKTEPWDGVRNYQARNLMRDDIKIGDVVDNFQMTVSVKTETLFATKDNLNNLIDEKINSDLSSDIELVEGSREWEIGEINKDENGKISIPVFVSQNSIAKIDIDKIKSEIAGKNELELRKYFVNIKGIKATDIGFWPFWVKSIPSSPDKINITIDINNSM